MLHRLVFHSKPYQKTVEDYVDVHNMQIDYGSAASAHFLCSFENKNSLNLMFQIHIDSTQFYFTVRY